MRKKRYLQQPVPDYLRGASGARIKRVTPLTPDQSQRLHDVEDTMRRWIAVNAHISHLEKELRTCTESALRLAKNASEMAAEIRHELDDLYKMREILTIKQAMNANGFGAIPKYDLWPLVCNADSEHDLNNKEFRKRQIFKTRELHSQQWINEKKKKEDDQALMRHWQSNIIDLKVAGLLPRELNYYFAIFKDFLAGDTGMTADVTALRLQHEEWQKSREKTGKPANVNQLHTMANSDSESSH